jgi:hypothetical protein
MSRPTIDGRTRGLLDDYSSFLSPLGSMGAGSPIKIA